MFSVKYRNNCNVHARWKNLNVLLLLLLIIMKLKVQHIQIDEIKIIVLK